MADVRLTSADRAGLIIFGSALAVRGILQAVARAGEMPDLGWITTFAGIAAVWLSLGSRTRDIHDATVETKEIATQTEHNTNGELTRKLEEMEARVMTAMQSRTDEIMGQPPIPPAE